MKRITGKLAGGTATVAESVVVVIALGAMLMIVVAVLSHVFGG